MKVAVDLEQLTSLARAEVELHPIRTPQRRAAAALWIALSETKTVAAARNALTDFTTPETTVDALALLERLATELRHAVTQSPATEQETAR